MAVAVVKIINGVKTLVPLSGSTPTNEVTSGNMHSVTSNAVAEKFGVITRLTETPTVIGKWTDGNQDIKRAVLTIIIRPSNPATMSFNLQSVFGLNIIECVRISGCASASVSSSSSYNFPINCNWGDNWDVTCFYSTGDKLLYIKRGSEFVRLTTVYYVWLEYV